MAVSRQRLRQNFGQAAAAYDRHAAFQHAQTRRVFDAALMVLPEKATLLDIGCGTGCFSAVAKEKRPDWKLIGLDIAPGMCEVAAARGPAIAADAARLPVADAHVEAAVSSLCYQWVEDLPLAFTELSRVLKSGGRAVVASLGVSTLQELRAASAAAHLPLALLTMREFTEVKAAMRAAGFEILLAECTYETRYYAQVVDLLDSMRAIGAGNNFEGATRQVVTPTRWAAMVREYEKHRTPQGIPATWEHHFFVVGKP